MEYGRGYDNAPVNCPVSLEWFSVECRKTKTKVITLVNHKEHTQYNEPIKTRGNYRLTHSASELSGFTCSSSLTMNEKFQSR